jgi:hypothetical protein
MPEVPVLHLGWAEPRLPADSGFSPSTPGAPTAALASPARQHFVGPHAHFFSNYAAYAGPSKSRISALGIQPKVFRSQVDSAASGTLKSGLHRCWKLIKLGFR